MELKTKQRIALSALFFQSGLCFSTWAARIPDIKGAFDFSDSELGAILLIRPVGALFALPLSGILVDKYGSRYSSTAGIALFSLSLVLLGISPTVPLLVGSILLFGVAANLINISNNAQALVVQKKYGKVIMASFHGLWSLAGFFGAGIGALMLWLDLDIVPHFLIISGSVLIMLVFSFPHLTKEKSQQGGKKLAFKKPDNHLMVLGAIAFCGMMCEGCMFDWSAVYFKQVIEAEEGLIAVGYMAFMGMMAFGRLVSDSFTNRYGSTFIIQLSGILIFIGLLIAVIFPFLITGIIGFLLVGAGTSSVIPLTFTEVGNNKKFSSGIALAMVSTIGYFGFLFGPPLIGFIADLLSLRASFTLIAIVGIAISIIITIRSKKELKVEQSIQMEN